MNGRGTKRVLALAALLGVGLGAQAYARELGRSSIREAVFLGKNQTRSAAFLRDYIHTLPVPEKGVHVEQIEISTPFKQVVLKSRSSQGGYNPVAAVDEVERQPPPVAVEVTLKLTPSFPAHTPYTSPVAFGAVEFRDPNFWREFQIEVAQQGKLEPRGVQGRPLYSCTVEGPCWLVGAVVTLEFDPAEVASRATRVVVATPDGQRVETEFDLGKLR